MRNDKRFFTSGKTFLEKTKFLSVKNQAQQTAGHTFGAVRRVASCRIFNFAVEYCAPLNTAPPRMVSLRHRDRSRYIYTDSESVGAIVETPKLLEVLVEKDGGGLMGKDGVRD